MSSAIYKPLDRIADALERIADALEHGQNRKLEEVVKDALNHPQTERRRAFQ